MNDIKVGQVWENKHLFNDAYDVVVCYVNDGFVWSHYTDDDDLVKESQSDFLRLRRLKSDSYFLNENQKIVLEWLKANVLQDRESAMSSIFELGALWELRRFNDNDAIRVDDAK